MIALVQRVLRARVDVGERCVGAIERGLLVFVCAQPGDDEAVCRRLVDKLVALRIFSDAQGKMNLNVRQVQGSLLIVSQFTLAADLSGGHRPSFTGAAPPALARRLYEHVLDRARAALEHVQSGEFGADMRVSLVNDGPVTVPITLSARAGATDQR